MLPCDCGEFSHVNHYCCIQPIREEKQQTLQEEPLEEPLNWQYGDSEEENEKKGPPPKPILVFADIECVLSQDRVFTPNLICWSAEDKEDIHHTDSIPEFLDALEELTEVEEDDRPR